MEDKTAPRLGCKCNACEWSRDRIYRERRLDEDLADNYKRYLAGKLISREELASGDDEE